MLESDINLRLVADNDGSSLNVRVTNKQARCPSRVLNSCSTVTARCLAPWCFDWICLRILFLKHEERYEDTYHDIHSNTLQLWVRLLSLPRSLQDRREGCSMPSGDSSPGLSQLKLKNQAHADLQVQLWAASLGGIRSDAVAKENSPPRNGSVAKFKESIGSLDSISQQTRVIIFSKST